MSRLAWRSCVIGLLLVAAIDPSIVAADDADLRAVAALSVRISCDFHNEKLTEVAGWFSARCNYHFALDEIAFDEAGVALDTPITFQMADNTARASLELLLRPLELTWVARYETILITSVAKAETILEARVYAVRDLVETGVGVDFDSLLEVITGTIAPTTWSEVGGAGAIKQFHAGRCLVISQTREVHEEIDALLAKLRATRDVQGVAAVAIKSPSRPQSTIARPTVPLPRRSVVSAPQPAWRKSHTYE